MWCGFSAVKIKKLPFRRSGGGYGVENQLSTCQRLTSPLHDGLPQGWPLLVTLESRIGLLGKEDGHRLAMARKMHHLRGGKGSEEAMGIRLEAHQMWCACGQPAQISASYSCRPWNAGVASSTWSCSSRCGASPSGHTSTTWSWGSSQPHSRSSSHCIVDLISRSCRPSRRQKSASPLTITASEPSCRQQAACSTRLAELGISEADVADAVGWARQP